MDKFIDCFTTYVTNNSKTDDNVNPLDSKGNYRADCVGPWQAAAPPSPLPAVPNVTVKL